MGLVLGYFDILIWTPEELFSLHSLQDARWRIKRMHFCLVLTYFHVYNEDFLMPLSVQLWRPASRAGLAPTPVFTRSSWCLTRALRPLPPGHSLSLGAGAGSAEPGRQWEGNPPSPSPGRGGIPHRPGEMFVPTKSGLRAVCSPPSPGRGRGMVRGRGAAFPPARPGRARARTSGSGGSGAGPAPLGLPELGWGKNTLVQKVNGEG